MSDLFWIIPSTVLGLTAVWLLGMWVVYVFKNNEWRDILAWVIVGANVLSLVSLGLWLTVQSNSAMSTVGILILGIGGMLLALIWAAYQ